MKEKERILIVWILSVLKLRKKQPRNGKNKELKSIEDIIAVRTQNITRPKETDNNSGSIVTAEF